MCVRRVTYDAHYDMRYTGKQIEEALHLYSTTNLSARAVADRLGIGRQSVHNWIKAAGISRERNATRQYPESVRREVVRLYVEDNRSTRSIAEEIGASSSTIKRWLRDAGVLRSVSEAMTLTVKKYPPAVLEHAWSRHRAKFPKSTIARALGIPRGSIDAVIKRHETRTRIANAA